MSIRASAASALAREAMVKRVSVLLERDMEEPQPPTGTGAGDEITRMWEYKNKLIATEAKLIGKITAKRIQLRAQIAHMRKALKTEDAMLAKVRVE